MPAQVSSSPLSRAPTPTSFSMTGRWRGKGDVPALTAGAGTALGTTCFANSEPAFADFILKFDPSGAASVFASDLATNIRGMTCDADNNLYVTLASVHTILKFTNRRPERVCGRQRRDQLSNGHPRLRVMSRLGRSGMAEQAVQDPRRPTNPKVLN